MKIIDCGNPEPHSYHEHIDAHFKTQWCGGVCGCEGMGYRPNHGPGEHK